MTDSITEKKLLAHYQTDCVWSARVGNTKATQGLLFFLFALRVKIWKSALSETDRTDISKKNTKQKSNLLKDTKHFSLKYNIKCSVSFSQHSFIQFDSLNLTWQWNISTDYQNVLAELRRLSSKSQVVISKLHIKRSVFQISEGWPLQWNDFSTLSLIIVYLLFSTVSSCVQVWLDIFLLFQDFPTLKFETSNFKCCRKWVRHFAHGTGIWWHQHNSLTGYFIFTPWIFIKGVHVWNHTHIAATADRKCMYVSAYCVS